jgi:hypothetical protein
VTLLPPVSPGRHLCALSKVAREGCSVAITHRRGYSFNRQAAITKKQLRFFNTDPPIPLGIGYSGSLLEQPAKIGAFQAGDFCELGKGRTLPEVLKHIAQRAEQSPVITEIQGANLGPHRSLSDLFP